jgi:lipoate-protein ligase A
MKQKLNFICLKNVPIFEQLQLEEALLRTDERSFCIVNMGSPRAIVMGISGQESLLLDLPKVREQRVPVIRRFSGGGTVIVDENTLFVTFVMAKEHLQLLPYPEPILRWSSDLYAHCWKIPGFQLRENDYCIGMRKCGGNAHYMRRARWTHHTSFLWDYERKNMDLLLLPAKRPAYREERSHEEFLCRLKEYGATPQIRLEEVKQELVKLFYIQDFDPKSLEKKPHRQATSLIHLTNLR